MRGDCCHARLVDAIVVGAAIDERAFDSVYEALANTKVENGRASVEADAKAILGRIKKQDGSYSAVHRRVNEYLRGWVRDVLDTLVQEEEELVKEKGETDTARIEYSRICNNVAGALAKNGEYVAALAMFRRALYSTESLFGKQHPETVLIHRNIDTVLGELGDYESAMMECQTALAIGDPVLGEQHPDIVALLSGILEKTGDFEGALEAHEKYLGICETKKPHPSTAIDHNNLGVVLHKRGDYKGAFVEHRKALAIQETVLGQDHPETASSHSNIGSVFVDLGEYDDALKELHKAHAIREKVLGTQHPDTALSHNNIGSALFAQGDYEGSLKEQRKAAANLKARLARTIQTQF